MSHALALIAHDLKNSLGSLEAQLQAMTALGDPSALQPACVQAHQRCLELRQEFVQFLTLYSAEHGELKPLCEDESPHEILEALCASWQARWQATGNTLRITLQADRAPPFWHFDRRLVRLALDSAVHNASKFARQHVTVEAREDDGWLVLCVCDDGPGLGHGATCADHSTGLGTALAQAVAAAHRLGTRQGDVRLHSLEPAGACFQMRLP